MSLPLSDGDAGVAQTVKAMCQIIDHGKKENAVLDRVAWILSHYHVRSFDFDGEYRAIFHWICQSIRWTRDPTGKEALHSADEILRRGIGDCDDFSILMCAMLASCGHRTRLITISNHADEPETFSHIYPEVQLESGKWIPMDAGRKNPGFGKGPRNVFRRHVWDVDTGEDYEDSAGMGALGRGRNMMRRARMMGWATPNARPTTRGRVPQFRTGLRLGQDSGSSFDWSQFESELPALTTAVTGGTAQIVKAANAPQVAYSQESAALQTALVNQQINPLNSFTSSPTLLLLIGAGVLVAVMMSRDH